MPAFQFVHYYFLSIILYSLFILVGHTFSVINFQLVFVPIIFLAYGTGVSRPILMSKLTNSVIKKETGTVLGVNNSLNSIVHILAPIVGTLIIQYLTSQLVPLLAALFFSSLLFFLRNRVD